MKIEEQVLSREQMAHLEELGANTSPASMCWMVDLEDGEEEVVVFNPIMLGYATCRLYPTYTIGDLIEKLPKEIDGRKIIIDFKRGAIGYPDFQILLLQDFELGTILTRMYHLLCWVAENHKELII